MNKNVKIINDVTEYYEDKLKKYGPVPSGVDWNSKESQQLRFEQLLKVVNIKDRVFKILDYGCGYGSLYNYMKNNYQDIKYTGFDSSKNMIEQARKLYHNSETKWTSDINTLKKYDFVIASGIFNVRLDYSDEEWLQYILKTLKKFNDISIKGFAFNILTKFSDKEYMKDYLFYADPCYLFDYCKKNFSKYISLLHDYPLYEFTIIVRK